MEKFFTQSNVITKVLSLAYDMWYTVYICAYEVDRFLLNAVDALLCCLYGVCSHCLCFILHAGERDIDTVVLMLQGAGPNMV
jgi:hypothetical protein